MLRSTIETLDMVEFIYNSRSVPAVAFPNLYIVEKFSYYSNEHCSKSHGYFQDVNRK